MTGTADLADQALKLFLAGATYAQIAQAVECDVDAVGEAVLAGLAGSAGRREVLDRNARAVAQERTEALFRAHWPSALRGDHRSAELCRRILEKQLEKAGEAGEVVGDAVDEIAARRASRRARSPRARAKRSS